MFCVAVYIIISISQIVDSFDYRIIKLSGITVLSALSSKVYPFETPEKENIIKTGGYADKKYKRKIQNISTVLIALRNNPCRAPGKVYRQTN
jgi:hypothetical protein